MKASRSITVCGALFAALLGSAFAQNSQTDFDHQADSSQHESASQRRTAVVLRFAVESPSAADQSEFSAQACPEPPALAASPSPSPAPSLTVDPHVLDTISEEMQKKLSKQMSVLVDPEPAAVPVGAIVISGCITRAKTGNGAARLIGMNVGASRLVVHVVSLSRTKEGWFPIDTFNLQVKGGDLLPPLGPVGLALHAARDSHQTLSADAKTLANRIVKKLSQDTRNRDTTTRNT